MCLQEAYIADLDAKSGASLKLTILNPKGRIWTMVAGGGASVVYRYRSQGSGAGGVAMEMSLWGGTVCHAVTAWDLPGMKVLCRCLLRMWNAVSFRSDNLTLGR